jgi:hypothetical protein
MNRFQQRSSWPSSLLTGLIGWIGWIFIGPLIFGINVGIKTQLLIALPAAIAQIALLRLLFFVLQLHRHLFAGIFWGLASAIALYFAAAYFFPELKGHMLYWLLIYGYAGAPVGGFLSYFYRDDHKLHEEQKNTVQVNYGRDAHWLEPFGFGVVAYIIAFLPFTDLQFALNVVITGAVSGVAAAGASHFSPDKWKRSYLLLGLLILTLGTVQGGLTGLLFRNCDEKLAGNYLLKGATGGVLTYLITFIRGRQLAYKEEKGLL